MGSTHGARRSRGAHARRSLLHCRTMQTAQRRAGRGGGGLATTHRALDLYKRGSQRKGGSCPPESHRSVPAASFSLPHAECQQVIPVQTDSWFRAQAAGHCERPKGWYAAALQQNQHMVAVQAGTTCDATLLLLSDGALPLTNLYMAKQHMLPCMQPL